MMLRLRLRRPSRCYRVGRCIVARSRTECLETFRTHSRVYVKEVARLEELHNIMMKTTSKT